MESRLPRKSKNGRRAISNSERGKASEAGKVYEESLCLDVSSVQSLHTKTNANSSRICNDTFNGERDMQDLNDTKCGSCSNRDKLTNAYMFCDECEETLCKECSSFHASHKLTNCHILTPYMFLCKSCLDKNATTQALNVCGTCEEALCDKCVLGHMSENHDLVVFKNTCEPCKGNELVRTVFKVCIFCEEFLCKTCSKSHKTQKATKNHKQIKISDVPNKRCKPCLKEGKNVVAYTMCKKCDETLCNHCIVRHKSQKTTKAHHLHGLELSISEIKPCDLCDLFNEVKIAYYYCLECKEFYCAKCRQMHVKQKVSRNHELIGMEHAKDRRKELSTNTVQIKRSMDQIIKPDLVEPHLPGLNMLQSGFEVDQSTNARALISRNKNKETQTPELAEEEDDKRSYSTVDSCKACLCNLKKAVDNTMTELTVTKYSDIMKSVGALIRSNGDVIGTVFRAGTHYVITAWHCVLQVIDPHSANAQHWSLLGNASVDFNLITSHPHMIKDVPYYDEDLDIAVLELADQTDLPASLNLFPHNPSFFDSPYVDMIGYGHPRNNSKILDSHCKVVFSSDKSVSDGQKYLLQNKERLLQDLEETVVPERVEWGYAEYDRNDKINFSCFMEKGASGSPVFIGASKGDPVVVAVVIKGLPACFWDLSLDSQSRFPSEYRIEMGTRMAHIYEAMKISKPELQESLFG